MKKVNFFNFPSYNINVQKLIDNSFVLKKSTKNTFKCERINFQSWCNLVKINQEKLIIKVVSKFEQI